MNDIRGDFSQLSRRTLLGTLATGSVFLAGCIGGDDDEDPDTGGNPEFERPVRGDPDASITLEAYEDFSCPHCQSYNQNEFLMVESEYLDPGLIRYEHRDLPFIAEESWQAASGAREVFLEYGNDEFWEYKSELMAAGDRLGTDTPDLFGEIAEDLGLDGETVQEAAVERMHDDAAEADRERATNLGVDSTPSFVVDGELMDNLDDALRTIDEKRSE